MQPRPEAHLLASSLYLTTSADYSRRAPATRPGAAAAALRQAGAGSAAERPAGSGAAPGSALADVCLATAGDPVVTAAGWSFIALGA